LAAFFSSDRTAIPERLASKRKEYNMSNLIRVVEIPSTKVASFHIAESKTPEEDAMDELTVWARPLGILGNLHSHHVYGFNNPWGEEGELRGYEFWVTLPDDSEIDVSEICTKQFSGGRYAVVRLKGVSSIQAAWRSLKTWIDNSEDYTLGYPKDFNIGEAASLDLEEFLSDPSDASPDKLLMDYHMPIAAK